STIAPIPAVAPTCSIHSGYGLMLSLAVQKSEAAALLLPPRRNPGSDGDAGRLVLSVPDHLLPQRAQLHRAAAEARADRLPQDRQRLPRRRRRRRAAGRRRQTQPANHPPTARLLDPDPGTEVLRQG